MGIENINNKKVRFDLKSEPSRAELVRRLVSQSATVVRSSGEEEYDWYVSGVHADGIVVSKTGQQNMQKKIPLGQFKEKNPELFFGIDVVE